MLWALLIWVIGLVTYGFVWVFTILMRAAMRGYDLELYLEVMNAVFDEDDAEMRAKYSKFIRVISVVYHNILWPYKLVWLTKKFVPRFDERYADLMIENLKTEEA